MITILGGTFAFLHPGHKELLSAAVRTGNRVVVGLTTDAYLLENKKYGNVPYAERKKKVAEYLKSLGASFDIVELSSKEGNSESGEDYGCIVVSEETHHKALRINETRLENGLKPMEIVVVPYVLAEDLFPVSSTRIIKGEIDENGKRRIPVRISVATGNSLKADAVNEVFGSMMDKISLDMKANYATDIDQPFGDDTVDLAKERALSVLENYDYSVGIEAGIFRVGLTDTYLDVHCAAIADRKGSLTIGFSSAFQIPSTLVREVKRGLSLDDAVKKLFDLTSVGSKSGLVGIMSGKRVTRKMLIVEAVRNALIPRMNSEHYPCSP